MASEKRLISADVAKEMIVNHANEFSDVLNRREKALLIGGGTSCIDKCPTVDAVEVVRCKDCQHRGDNVHCPMCFEEQIEWDDDGYPEIDWILHDRTTDEGFCSYGERREGE